MTNSSPSHGFVYILGCPEGYYKIGRSTTLTDRIQQLAIQLPFKVHVVCILFALDCRAKERDLHRTFKSKRVNGEWFKLSDNDLTYIQTVHVVNSDAALASVINHFRECGDEEALAGALDLWRYIPNHLLSFSPDSEPVQ